jgi:hypothetical protein
MTIYTSVYQKYNKDPLPPSFVEYKQKDQMLQERARRIFSRLRNFIADFLNSQHIMVKVATISPSKYMDVDVFFQRFREVLSNAVEAWMCVGQMGFRFMEHADVLKGFQAAVANNATIHIIRGPRKDPKTTSVVELAKRGNIKFHILDHYPEDHFFVVKTKSSPTFLILESPHPEVIRGLKEGEEAELHSGRYRVFTIFPNSGLLGSYMLRVAKKKVALNTGTTRELDLDSRGYDIHSYFRDSRRIAFTYPFELALYIMFYIIQRQFLRVFKPSALLSLEDGKGVISVKERTAFDQPPNTSKQEANPFANPKSWKKVSILGREKDGTQFLGFTGIDLQKANPFVNPKSWKKAG